MLPLEFAAWSLYTGPANLNNIIDDPSCPWVVGRWTGINGDTSPDGIRRDIDARIDLLTIALKSALPGFRTPWRYFVVPEFFFHCQQGPYPDILIDGQPPVEYIRSKVTERLQALIPDDGNYYSVLIGSILTSNIDDYPSFLSSGIVTQRLMALQKLLPPKLANARHPSSITWSRYAGPVSLDRAENGLVELNNFMTACRADPLCTVRNRGIFFCLNNPGKSAVESFVYEKQNESTVDLTMGMFGPDGRIGHGGMITEWMANYPSYSIIKGDKQTSPYSTASRFNPANLQQYDVGVEICLDHRLQRLRRTVGMTIAHGADADNLPLALQLVPSGGMQILDYSVAADQRCVIFNADGCDKVYSVYGDENTVILNGNPGPFKGITCGVYNQSIQSKWKGRDQQTYYSHSQLAFATADSQIDGFNNALGNVNQKAKTFSNGPTGPYNPLTDSYSSKVIPLGGESDLFIAGAGEVHLYAAT